MFCKIYKKIHPQVFVKDLRKTIDKRVCLEDYNKSEIKQLDTCRLTVKHGKITKLCHFYMSGSEIYGVLKCYMVNDVTDNVPDIPDDVMNHFNYLYCFILGLIQLKPLETLIKKNSEYVCRYVHDRAECSKT